MVGSLRSALAANSAGGGKVRSSVSRFSIVADSTRSSVVIASSSLVPLWIPARGTDSSPAPAVLLLVVLPAVEAGDDGLQHGDGHLGVVLERGAELPRGDQQADELGLRGDRGGAAVLLDQGQLAEEVSRTQPADLATALADDGAARCDQEQAGRRIALADHDLARLVALLAGGAQDLLAVARLEDGEQRDRLGEARIHRSSVGLAGGSAAHRTGGGAA